MEKSLPYRVIKLATTPTEEANRQAELNAICNKKGASFKAFRKNCSTIVSQVQHAGGYDSLKWEENNNWVCAPSDILKLALIVRPGAAIKCQKDG